MADPRPTPAADPAYNPADPTTRQTPVDNPPEGVFKATYHPGPGEPKTVTAYGKTFKAGDAVELDPRFRGKVAGNPFFSIDGQKTYGDELREQSKVEPEVEDEDDNLTFEENVVANRMEEYGTSDPVAAETMRRENETNFARVGAPRRRGRPPKEQARAEAKARAEEHSAEMDDIKAEQTDEANAEAERQARVNAALAEQRRK